MQISSRNYLTLKGLAALESSQNSKGKAAPTIKDLSPKKPSEPKLRISTPEISSKDSAQLRAENTKGLGNRLVGESALATDQSVYEIYPDLAPSEDNLSLYSATDPAPSTEELRQLRSSIEDVTTRYLRNNPNSSLDDLKTEIDDHFGSGFSDVIGIDQIDHGNGDSEIRIQQTDFNDLTIDEKNIFNRAVSLAQTNFTQPEANRELTGIDITDKLNRLEIALGSTSKPFVADLRNQLQDSVVDESLSSSQEFLKGADNIFTSLKKEDENNRASFNAKPFSDDLYIRYRSGRYASAYSPASVETVGLLTAD